MGGEAVICENMICAKCATEGKTSRVWNTRTIKTLGSYLPFYDEQGRHHFHDANVTNAEYRCTNGHVWNTHGMGSCWCGWPNEQKPAPAEPAVSTKTRRFTVYRRDLVSVVRLREVPPADQPQYEGVVFSDGTTVVRWLTAARSTSVWADFDTLWKIHGHDDPNSKHGTVIVWHDEAAVTTKEKP